VPSHEPRSKIATTFGCARPAALAAEALDELLVFDETALQDLDGDLTREQFVFGEIDVGHPARADPRDHAVAAVDDGTRVDLAHAPAFRFSASVEGRSDRALI